MSDLFKKEKGWRPLAFFCFNFFFYAERASPQLLLQHVMNGVRSRVQWREVPKYPYILAGTRWYGAHPGDISGGTPDRFWDDQGETCGGAGGGQRYVHEVLRTWSGTDAAQHFDPAACRGQPKMALRLTCTWVQTLWGQGGTFPTRPPPRPGRLRSCVAPADEVDGDPDDGMQSIYLAGWTDGMYVTTSGCRTGESS